MIETRYAWTLTGNSSAGSTMVGAKHDLNGHGIEHAWYLRTSSGCTATVTLYTAESTTVDGISWSTVAAMSSASGSVVQVTGAFLAVWPSAIMSSGSSATLNVNLISIGGAQ